ncbi:anion permease [Staphylococcus aureus]
MFPIIKSLSESFGSKPKMHISTQNGCISCFHKIQGNLITAAMFLTAMAGNPLAQNLASSTSMFILHG